MTEKELIEKCRQNKPSAQKTLYERYAPKMMGVCLRYTSDHDSAKDMLQEGFISVFTNFHLFEGKGSLEGWIRRIVINSALQHLRKNVVFTTEADMSEYENEYSTNVSALEELSAKDLMKIINTLPSGFKTVFNLYAIEGY